MRSSTHIATWFGLFALVCAANSNSTAPLSSNIILPENFKPPQVFKNVNLLRNINLEKGYIRERINVVIENTDAHQQDEYYIPFKAEVIGKVGGLEVKDKKNPEKPKFQTEVVEFDPYSPTQFFKVTLPEPLQKSSQATLSISYHLLSSLIPLPATIKQDDKQFLLYAFSALSPSAYLTQNQKTKIKFPTVEISDFTSEPQRQGSTFTYGPYENTPAGAEQEASARYEFTKPVIHATLLERDVEISQWGGNLATEERYWLTNKGASLANHFSRVTWATTQYYNPPTSALRTLHMPLKIGSLNPYFIDDIGNVSTSRFRSNRDEATLELKPRYPVFGGWNYSFRTGWDANLKGFLRILEHGNGHVLRVPFLEGPKMGEGISYEKVELRIILPEGATNIKYQTSVPLVSAEISTHKTFMDTLGRTCLKLSAMNLIDESRDEDLFVTYDYSFSAALRKPITVFLGVATVFVAAWAVGRLN
ncbi:dolichyl-diphosphooligosaccharide--protein glycosyltransferase subunit 1, partial [Pseudocyphellaria aurata]|nr:dolichyl-diphosphooligosaccharide--protein glycosyltransferase subunit 1 [Pseudocyphellaria aurata]